MHSALPGSAAMTNTQLVTVIGISAVVAIASNVVTATRGSARPAKDHPGLYVIPPRWATLGGPTIAGIATALSAAAAIASLLMI